MLPEVSVDEATNPGPPRCQAYLSNHGKCLMMVLVKLALRLYDPLQGQRAEPMLASCEEELHGWRDLMALV